jgi:hypothetical protein
LFSSVSGRCVRKARWALFGGNGFWPACRDACVEQLLLECGPCGSRSPRSRRRRTRMWHPSGHCARSAHSYHHAFARKQANRTKRADWPKGNFVGRRGNRGRRGHQWWPEMCCPLPLGVGNRGGPQRVDAGFPEARYRFGWVRRPGAGGVGAGRLGHPPPHEGCRSPRWHATRPAGLQRTTRASDTVSSGTQPRRWWMCAQYVSRTVGWRCVWARRSHAVPRRCKRGRAVGW